MEDFLLADLEADLEADLVDFLVEDLVLVEETPLSVVEEVGLALVEVLVGIGLTVKSVLVCSGGMIVVAEKGPVGSAELITALVVGKAVLITVELMTTLELGKAVLRRPVFITVELMR